MGFIPPPGRSRDSALTAQTVQNAEGGSPIPTAPALGPGATISPTTPDPPAGPHQRCRGHTAWVGDLEVLTVCFGRDQGPSTDEDRPLIFGTGVDQAVQVVINGKPRGPINITTANTSGDGNAVTVNPAPQPDTSLWARLRKPGGFIVGTAAVVGVLVTIAAWQNWNPF